MATTNNGKTEDNQNADELNNINKVSNSENKLTWKSEFNRNFEIDQIKQMQFQFNNTTNNMQNQINELQSKIKKMESSMQVLQFYNKLRYGE